MITTCRCVARRRRLTAFCGSTADFCGRGLLSFRTTPRFAPQRRSCRTFADHTEKRHLIFFGSDSFSIAVFRELLTQYRLKLSSIEVCVVRRHVLFAKYLRAFHQDVKIHVWPHLPKVDVTEEHKFALVASFGKLIPENFISRLPNRIINIHPSLLPRWRGAAPLPRCILAGDLVVGVSVVEIAARRFDVGKVYAQQEFVPSSEMKINTLSEQLATAGVRLLVNRILPDFNLAAEMAVTQSSLPYKSRLARRMQNSDLIIDWSSQTATELVRLFAATLATDHHHKQVKGQLRTRFAGLTVRLVNVDLMPAFDHTVRPVSLGHHRRSDEPEFEESAARPGRVVFDLKHRDRLLVKTKRGWISVRRLIYRKAMTAQDFWNGYLSKRPESDHYFG